MLLAKGGRFCTSFSTPQFVYGLVSHAAACQ